jgi:phosphate:Na+ symporter
VEIVLSVFALLGGIGVFMMGMKLMSDGLEHGAGKGIERLLGKISNNRFAGFGIGTAVTGIIQSSSATTVMVVGLVNAGIMTLFQATSIIMGANVGTTVTGLLAALSAFKVDAYFAALAFIGVFIEMFSKKEKLAVMGKILSGLGFIFIGLSLMGAAFKNNGDLNNAVSSLFSTIDFPLLLVLFGIIFTGIIQSSSAFVSIVITLVGAGVLPLEGALFVILGSNIGTCVTALLASVGTTVNAKRAAAVHLLFNITGTVIFVIFLWIFKNPIVRVLESLIPVPRFQVAVFHTVFNVGTALLLLPFVKQLVAIAERIIPDKHTKEAESDLKLKYIDDRLLSTPPIAIAQLKKEVKAMAELSKLNFTRGVKSIIAGDLSAKKEIFREEAEINFVNKKIAAFLIKLSSVSSTASEEQFIGSLHHVISDIERIGDYAQNFIEETEKILEKKIIFTDAALKEIENMYDKILVMFDVALDILMTNDVKKFNEVATLEDEVDEMKRTYGDNHIKRLNEGNCSVDSGAYFYAVISGLERIADHLTNIAFSIKSPSGSQREAMEMVAKEHKG